MGLFEKKDLRDYIATWSTQLSPDYKAAWNEWLKKRDIVAKQMGLDEKQILYVTKITLMTYLGYDFKRKINLNSQTIDKVVKTTVFIQNIKDFATVNEIYNTYFKEPYPARSCVEVARLPKDVLLEIEAVVAK